MAGGGDGDFLFRVDGMGGHIDVFTDRLELHRHGLLHLILELLKLYEGSTDTVIPLRFVTAVTIVEPLMLPGYMRFAYAGAPAYSPHYWVDAMQPNAILMGLIDTRGFHRLKAFLDARR